MFCDLGGQSMAKAEDFNINTSEVVWTNIYLKLFREKYLIPENFLKSSIIFFK